MIQNCVKCHRLYFTWLVVSHMPCAMFWLDIMWIVVSLVSLSRFGSRSIITTTILSCIHDNSKLLATRLSPEGDGHQFSSWGVYLHLEVNHYNSPRHSNYNVLMWHFLTFSSVGRTLGCKFLTSGFGPDCLVLKAVLQFFWGHDGPQNFLKISPWRLCCPAKLRSRWL